MHIKIFFLNKTTQETNKEEPLNWFARSKIKKVTATKLLAILLTYCRVEDAMLRLSSELHFKNSTLVGHARVAKRPLTKFSLACCQSLVVLQDKIARYERNYTQLMLVGHFFV